MLSNIVGEDIIASCELLRTIESGIDRAEHDHILGQLQFINRYMGESVELKRRGLVFQLRKFGIDSARILTALIRVFPFLREMKKTRMMSGFFFY